MNYQPYRSTSGQYKKRGKHVLLAVLLGTILFGFAYTLILPVENYTKPTNTPVIEQKSNIQKLTDNVSVRYTELQQAEKELIKADTKHSKALDAYNVAIISLNTYMK